MKKTSQIKVMRWICKNNGIYICGVIVIALISASISGSFILLALLSKKILDISVSGAQNETIAVCGIEIIIVLFVQAIMNIVNANLRIRITTKLEMQIRNKSFSGLLKKQYLEIQKLHSGEILNRFTSDLEIVVSGITNLIPQLSSMLIQIVGGISILFFINSKFMLLVLLSGAVVAIGNKIYGEKFRNLHKNVQYTNGRISSFLQECIQNFVMIKSFDNEENILGQLNRYQEENYIFRKKRTVVSNIANTGVYIIFSSAYYAILIWGALGVATGEITFGTIAAILQIAGQIQEPFRGMSGMLQNYYSMLASAERIMELENLEGEKDYEKVSDIVKVYEKMTEICLEKAEFAYENGERIFQDASLEIKKDTFVVITGVSGAGKSTYLKALLSLIQLHSGKLELRLENNNKRNIDAGLREMFAYVPQGNLVFSGTIRENLIFGNKNVTGEELKKATKDACIEDVIDALPEGYDTLLGERGIGLSEGQNQRLAIARALLSNAPILLLDECTSALDNDTEKKLMRNLRQLKNRTVICVSHKNCTLQYCDRNVRLENGKFIEE